MIQTEAGVDVGSWFEVVPMSAMLFMELSQKSLIGPYDKK